MWSTLRHPNVVSFIGACVSSVGPLSLCEHFPEGNLFQANAALLAQAQEQANAVREGASHSSGAGGAGGAGGSDLSSTFPPPGCNGHPVAFGMRSGWMQLSYAKQICRAMTYLHTLTPCPVLFRNLKSTNVMLADGHTRVALTDFAICRESKARVRCPQPPRSDPHLNASSSCATITAALPMHTAGRAPSRPNPHALHCTLSPLAQVLSRSMPT